MFLGVFLGSLTKKKKFKTARAKKPQMTEDKTSIEKTSI